MTDLAFALLVFTSVTLVALRLVEQRRMTNAHRRLISAEARYAKLLDRILCQFEVQKGDE